MPRDTSDIGSHGLEQGGANLGNDYSRPITTDRNEQNTTTNVGSSGTTASEENEADRSERILDKEEDEQDPNTLEEKAQSQTDKLKNASEQDSQRSDNQNPSERILDGDDKDGDEGGSLPDRETLKLRGEE